MIEPTSLHTLPVEIVQKIAMDLDSWDRNALARTSRFFRDAININNLRFFSKKIGDIFATPVSERCTGLVVHEKQVTIPQENSSIETLYWIYPNSPLAGNFPNLRRVKIIFNDETKAAPVCDLLLRSPSVRKLSLAGAIFLKDPELTRLLDAARAVKKLDLSSAVRASLAPVLQHENLTHLNLNTMRVSENEMCSLLAKFRHLTALFLGTAYMCEGDSWDPVFSLLAHTPAPLRKVSLPRHSKMSRCDLYRLLCSHKIIWLEVNLKHADCEFIADVKPFFEKLTRLTLTGGSSDLLDGCPNLQFLMLEDYKGDLSPILGMHGLQHLKIVKSEVPSKLTELFLCKLNLKSLKIEKQSGAPYSSASFQNLTLRVIQIAGLTLSQLRCIVRSCPNLVRIDDLPGEEELLTLLPGLSCLERISLAERGGKLASLLPGKIPHLRYLVYSFPSGNEFVRMVGNVVLINKALLLPLYGTVFCTEVCIDFEYRRRARLLSVAAAHLV